MGAVKMRVQTADNNITINQKESPWLKLNILLSKKMGL